MSGRSVKALRLIGAAAIAVSVAAAILSLYASVKASKAYALAAPIWLVVAYVASRLSKT